MPRRADITPRVLEADPIHGSTLVTQFINAVMLDGKRSTAERLVYDALAIVAEKTGKPPIEIDYALPKEGALMWFDSFAIPKDAEHVEEAHIFIDFMMRPEIAARNTNFVAYASGNLEAQKSVDKEILANRSIYPDEVTFARLFTVTPYPQDVQRIVTRIWTRVKSGR